MIHFKYNDSDCLSIQADRESFSALRDWLTQILSHLKISAKECKKMLVSADEIFTNTATYGYPPEADEKPLDIFVSYDDEQKILSVKFKDYGMPFNPLDVPSGHEKERVKQHIVGGLGLFLVHQFMDDLEYNRENECNVMTISKRIREFSGECTAC